MVKLSENTDVRLSLVLVLAGAFYWVIASIISAAAVASSTLGTVERHEKLMDALTVGQTNMGSDLSAIRATQSAILQRQDRMEEYLRAKLR